MSQEIKDIAAVVEGVAENVVSKQEAELRKDTLEEMTEDGVAKFYSEFKPIPKRALGKKASIPEADKVIGLEYGGVRFGDDVWSLEYQDSRSIELRFRKQSEAIEIDLTGKISRPLVYLSKVLTWGSMKDSPGRSVNSASSIHYHLRSSWVFIAYLQQHDFLLNIENTPIKPLRLLRVKDLRKLLEEGMEKKRASVYVAGFFRVVARWLHLSERVDLPEELRPGFTVKDWQGDRAFVKKIMRYEAERVTPWSDIPHDHLMVLLGESQAYLNDFSDDILYMQDLTRRLEEAAGPENLKKKGKQFIKGNYLSGELYDEIVKHNWAIDPRSNKPWYDPDIKSRTHSDYTSKKTGEVKVHDLQPKILHGEWNEQLTKLVDCCNFKLTLWTAARVSELIQFKAEGLFINGKRYRPEDGDAILAFKQSIGPDGRRDHKFELEFRIFKTSKDKQGKLVKIPLGDGPARAFCLLIEIFRIKREKLSSPFLIPRGGLNTNEVKKEDAQKPVHHGYFRTCLTRLCRRLSIDEYHPHCCRKTLATMIIKKNPDSLELIQRLLNHLSPTMTLRYLMEIPGISSAVKQKIIETNRKRLIKVITATATRRIGGRAGKDMVEGTDSKYLQTTMIEETIREYVEVLLDDGNFIIHELPAAWCMRFFTQNPERLPCLPDSELVDVPLNMFAPDPAKCRPWECGHSLHTRKHLRKAKRNAREARRVANSKGLRADLAASFDLQATYWEEVVDHLENGYVDYDDILPTAIFEMVD